MKERPILFSGPMVRAILDGKTQTRRVVKPQPIPQHHIGFLMGQGTLDKPGFHVLTRYASTVSRIECPYGKPGDRLWVRETWAVSEEYDYAYKNEGGVFYRAAGDPEHDTWGGWRPSIHMPRWASRITLEVTNVRVERVQEISDEDAIAEGTGHGFVMNGGWPDYRHIENGVCTLTQDSAEMSFSTLWDTINAKRGYGWDANPWVWVVEFRRVKP